LRYATGKEKEAWALRTVQSRYSHPVSASTGGLFAWAVVVVSVPAGWRGWRLNAKTGRQSRFCAVVVHQGNGLGVGWN